MVASRVPDGRAGTHRRVSDPSKIVDAFWNKDLFDAFRQGNWGFNFPLQQSDVDTQFSVFSFILSVDPLATWPPRIPSNGLSVGSMVQLGRNLLWFLDLALAQPGQPGSLLLEFSLLGDALSRQFEFLDQLDLVDQWDATHVSRQRHAYAFLAATHRLLAEMQRWFTSDPLVYHVHPEGASSSSVMALSPLIANRRGQSGNIWHQREEWLKMVTDTFHEHFASSQRLRDDPPSWIMQSTPRPAGTVSASKPTPTSRTPGGGREPQGEQQKPGTNAKRDRNLSSTPAVTPTTTVPAEQKAAQPLFVLSSTLQPALKGKQPGQILFHLSKADNVKPPAYGSGNATKMFCFNFATEGHVCTGRHYARKGTVPAGVKPCDRLHLDLGPNGEQRSDPSSHFRDIVRFLHEPAVASYFTPTDTFATSQQYLDAVADL
jgi:hypothetical protein